MGGAAFFHPYALAMMASGFISLFLCIYAWMGTRKGLARSFAFFEIAIFLWAAFRMGLWLASTPESRLQAFELQYLGIAFAPGALYLLARALDERPAKALLLAAILASGAAFFAIIITNDAHRLFWPSVDPAALPRNPVGGPAFWAFAVYAYAFVALSLWTIGKIARRAKGRFGRSMRRLFWLCALPSIANAIFVLFFIGRTAYDPTPIIFAVTGLVLGLEFSSFDIFDSVPFAKSAVLESIGCPILVTDSEGYVVGGNKDAMAISPSVGSLSRRPIAEIVDCLDGSEAEGETKVWARSGVEYNVLCCFIKKERLRRRGRIYIFRDVTIQELARQESETARREAESARAKADAANAAKS